MFLKKFWDVGAWMLELIILFSFLLGKMNEVYIVLVLLLLNAVIGYYQEKNAAGAVDALGTRLQVKARVLRDGKWSILEARELVPGDYIRLRIGDFVPADVSLEKGEISADQSVLTGESLAVLRKPGDKTFAGSVIRTGEAFAVVEATGSKTFYGRTAQLVAIARPHMHIEDLTGQVATWLLITVTLLLAAALMVAYGKGMNMLEILPLILVLLLSAGPVTLPAMFTVSMAVGSMRLVKRGVLVTRLNALDDAAQMDILCADKTGTITQNKMAIYTLVPLGGFKEKDVVLYGILASEEANIDPLDNAFIEAAQKMEISAEDYVQKSFIPFSSANRHTEALIEKDGKEIKVLKGSFEVLSSKCEMGEADKKEALAKELEFGKKGYRTLAVALQEVAGGSTKMVGLAVLHDPPRATSKQLIEDLKTLGVNISLLTGDSAPIAEEVAKDTGIENVLAEIYPEDKYRLVEDLQKLGHIVGMTGDGVNDAPALKQAEVGIAVRDATDVAKNSASIVLTEEGLDGIVHPIKEGRMLFSRMNAWIVNKISETVLKTCFVVFVFFALGEFIISATAMIIILFLNDFMKIALSVDNARWSRKPAVWDVVALTKVAAAMGFIMVLEAIALLFLGIYYYGLGTRGGMLETFSFEILLFFLPFFILSARESGHFWESAPSKTFFAIVLGNIILGAAISIFGLIGLAPIPLGLTLFAAAFSLFFALFANDFIKVYLFEKFLPRDYALRN